MTHEDEKIVLSLQRVVISLMIKVNTASKHRCPWAFFEKKLTGRIRANSCLEMVKYAFPPFVIGSCSGFPPNILLGCGKRH